MTRVSPIDSRGRAYLDGNCAHCHDAEGQAAATGLFLNLETKKLVDLGICRHPFSAGSGSGDLLFDVVPGRPEESVMVYRMESTDPDIKMPELPSLTSDRFGAELITAWIASLTPEGCK